jgi:phenylacetyl-CoA:acceptor oxidoreductase subunit 1
MPRWVMVIDLPKCNGCERCVVSCTQTNQVPIGIAWRRVLTAEVQVDSSTRRVFVPMSCMHCANPPCRDVCPTGATQRHANGIVDIDATRCVGCGFCVVACPYMARTIVSENPAPSPAQPAAPWTAQPSASRFDRGVCTKCDMCRSKIEAAAAHGLTIGIDPEATPTCVNACLWGAIHFGDADQPDSTVARLLRENEMLRIHEELGTEPSIYYMNAGNVLSPSPTP